MITVLLVVLSQVLGRCHQSHAGSCARVYFHDNCHGESKSLGQGGERYIGHHWNDQISSMVVKKGCVVYGYEHHHYKGGATNFRGKVTSLRKHKTYSWFRGSHWNDKISSWSCKCNPCKWYTWNADCW